MIHEKKITLILFSKINIFMFKRSKRLLFSLLAVLLMFLAIILIYNPVRAWFYCGDYYGYGFVSDWQCWIPDRAQDRVLLGHYNNKTQKFKLSVESSSDSYYIQTPLSVIKLKSKIQENSIEFNRYSKNQLLINNEVFLIKRLK